jgi:hypothetical protein
MLFSIARTIAHDLGESEEQEQPILRGQDRETLPLTLHFRRQVTEGLCHLHGGFKAAAAMVSPTVRMYLLPSRDRRSSDAALFRHPLGVGPPGGDVSYELPWRWIGRLVRASCQLRKGPWFDSHFGHERMNIYSQSSHDNQHQY